MTWSHGPQMVGFAMWHVHPGFALVGVVSSFVIALWLLITIPYALVHRRELGRWDWLMTADSLAVIVELSLPDALFASSD